MHTAECRELGGFINKNGVNVHIYSSLAAHLCESQLPMNPASHIPSGYWCLKVLAYADCTVEYTHQGALNTRLLGSRSGSIIAKYK